MIKKFLLKMLPVKHIRTRIVRFKLNKWQYALTTQLRLQISYLERTSKSRGSFTSLLMAGFDCLFRFASSSAATSNSAMNCSTIRPISARGRSFFFFFLLPLKSRSISSSSSPSSAYSTESIHIISDNRKNKKDNQLLLFCSKSTYIDLDNS